MLEILGSIKPQLIARMEDWLQEIRIENDQINPWVADSLARIMDYSARGKMVRGGLVSVAARSFAAHGVNLGLDQEKSALEVGVVMELLQSLLLIHDDIMDQDERRRGKPSMHSQYVQLAGSSGIAAATRTGESMAICAGDSCAFLAMELLASLDLAPAIHQSLWKLVSRELTVVVFAQMGDVWNGAADRETGFDEILKLYRYKTGRYTFSLPLMCGALLVQAGADTIDGLSELGELLGILFQIRDDDIGLFADAARSGKPSGTDIRENKKTLHRHFLLERCDVAERKQLLSIFGNKQASPIELGRVLQSMRDAGVPGSIEAELQFYAGQARELIARLPGLNSWGREMLESLVVWNLNRNL